MERKIITTADGSTTIYLPEWNESYHSKHGAIQEAYHVFINHGLNYLREHGYNKISILEIGFGTGLNAFITALEAKRLSVEIDYCGVEAYPVPPEEVGKLNYSEQLNVNSQDFLFEKMHKVSWEEKHELLSSFSILKKQQFFNEISDQNMYDLIYFDAFGARVQSELWTKAIFEKMFNALKINGVLVTYSAKGSVRRAMMEVGFKVEKLPGPPGKREMLRAIKGTEHSA
ncbi:tRNA (5-methylaminomethyl-2-thiouridine)(34)-methyltransferase MnmD [Flavobacteriaceae bacterium XHP0103]|uniref:tRNA (5-methylaminomethyl-2-thiouridine)(34)-methyltransferase MnmD n=1 Tax=Marixanthotalea marina TaxID=2844359 RepID=UPI002989D55E|nr:tRNA (5-methylaminomethyl-2-thiouridine)(34)-methyltransferase MnmD [Marixanthotalea marina]MBU3822441.1 tRNA (5-methylaminomethyl-2-thiouridine)(34)-methyltransferase MnmD [Marixanthotalea marina]